MTRILVDMDGVIADWGREYTRVLDEAGSPARNIPRHTDQRGWDLNEGRSDLERRIIAGIMVRPGFYAALEPVPGARQALKQMLADGHDVRIVTSPWASNPTCASDKLNWVVGHYGSHWAKRVVMTADKTIVHGDFLIDDKPQITGDADPTWEHILFDQPYNRAITDRRRIHDWSAWADVLNLSIPKDNHS